MHHESLRHSIPSPQTRVAEAKAEVEHLTASLHRALSAKSADAEAAEAKVTAAREQASQASQAAALAEASIFHNTFVCAYISKIFPLTFSLSHS